MNIQIIGYGIVGQNIFKIFKDAWVTDPNLNIVYIKGKPKIDVAFVCVQTPKKGDGSCDISIVRQAIQENEAEVFCIKSTIPPGTTESLRKETGKNIVFSPEYYGETIHANNVDYNFVIVGGNKELTKKVVEAYKLELHSNVRFYQTDSKTAELCKYMENSFLATKVTFCNEFYRIANQIGVDYNELRELFLCDPRVNRSHTFVYENTPYYESKCLDKDIPAIIKFAESIQYDAKLLKQVVYSNDIFKS